MQHSEIEDKSVSKFQCIFMLILIAALLSVYLVGFFEEIRTLVLITNEPIAFTTHRFLIPAVTAIPTVVLLGYCIYKRLMGTLTDPQLNSTFKFIVINFPIFVISCILFYFSLNFWLQGTGYSKCNWYTRSTYTAPIVWVKDKEFCVKKASEVRIELLDWIDNQQKLKQTPTKTEVISKIDELLLTKNLPTRKT